MAKRDDYDVVLKASTSLITQLTMITSALAAGTIDLKAFWEGYSEAIESFVPEPATRGDAAPTTTAEAPPQANGGTA